MVEIETRVAVLEAIIDNHKNDIKDIKDILKDWRVEDEKNRKEIYKKFDILGVNIQTYKNNVQFSLIMFLLGLVAQGVFIGIKMIGN